MLKPVASSRGEVSVLHPPATPSCVHRGRIVRSEGVSQVKTSRLLPRRSEHCPFFLVKLLHPSALVGAEQYPGRTVSGVKLSRSTSVLRCKMQFPVPDRILPSPGAPVAISDCFISGGLLPGGAVASEGRLPRCRIPEKRSYLLFSSLEQASVPQKTASLLFAQVWAVRRVGVLCLCCLSFHGKMKENVSGNKDKRHARGFLRPTTSCAVGR